MSQQFKFKIKGNPQPFDALGLMVYLRTYGRRLREEDPNSPVENWAQCLTRCVNACNTQLNCNFSEEEAQEFFDLLHSKKCSLAGRFLWQLGTKTVDKLGLMSLQNCAFCTIDNYKSFTWLMNFLMLGAGVGYRITKEDVAQFPPVKSAAVIRQDNKDADFILGDHRGAWIQLLGKVLKAHFYTGKGFTFSTQLLRGKNEVIKGFGGVSSGGQVLCDGIAKINDLLNRRAAMPDTRLTTVDALDICNIIGMIVVSGNVRRCIPKGSLVHMADGKLKPIDKVEVGDTVLTRMGDKKIKSVFYQGKQAILAIFMEDGRFFRCTPNHRMAFVKDGDSLSAISFKEADKLTINQDHLIRLVEDESCNLTTQRIMYIAQEIGEHETWDIEVEDAHEFFCEGFLTHNSAQIACGTADDTEFLRAKRWDLGILPNWRCYSNNSILCDDIEEILDNEEFWHAYEGNGGECLGLINMKLARSCGRIGDTQYPDPKAVCVNPCSEQNLANYETCCLGEVFLPNITSYEELQKCVTYIYRACKHSLTLPCADSKETEDIVHEHMRMGIGMSGIMQASREQRSWLDRCYNYLREFDKEYSMKHKFPTSIKLTTVKPSGCSRKDSLILTTDGLLRLDEIGDIGGEQWQPISNKQAFTDEDKTEIISKFYVNGNVETRKILTLDGVELESSLNHRYRVLDDLQNYVWKTVQQLKVGDRLLVKLGGYNKLDGDLDLNLASMLGSLYASGVVLKKENLVGFVLVTDADDYTFRATIMANFPESQIQTAQTSYGKKMLWVFGHQFLSWLDENLCLDWKNIPKIIRQASISAIKSFICDYLHHIKDSRCKEIHSQFVQLCRAVNYEYENPVIHRNPCRRWKDFWIDTIVEITPSRCDTFDIEVENAHHYRLGGVISHNTLSLLGHVTPGIHPAYSQYLIRRMRVSTESKLVKLAKDHGYHVEFVKNFDGTLDYGTSVISFPYRYPEGTVVAKDLTAIAQLEWVKYIQTHWSDNAVSVTVYYKKEELPAIKLWLKENYNNFIKSVSFLLHSDHGFVQAPLEEITKEQYDEMVKACKNIENYGEICQTEGDEKFVADGECVSGACPLK